MVEEEVIDLNTQPDVSKTLDEEVNLVTQEVKTPLAFKRKYEAIISISDDEEHASSDASQVL